MPDFVRSSALRKATFEALHDRGIPLLKIAELTFFLQQYHIPNLTMEECLTNVEHVLEKREVQNAILTGVQLDKLAEKKLLDPPLQAIIEADESLYGIDEVLALSILNIYGTIGFTNYGYIDKLKHGVLQRLNDKSTGEIHTFMDDLVGAVAAAAASRMAHHYRGDEEAELDRDAKELET